MKLSTQSKQAGEDIDRIRLEASSLLDEAQRARLGQYMTPSSTAHFMASMFSDVRGGPCRLLDPGAGVGSLSEAFLRRCGTKGFHVESVDVDAFEIDPLLRGCLQSQLEGCTGKGQVAYRLFPDDFIELASRSLAGDFFASRLPRYTHAILNPPYKKIRSDSPHRHLLRRAGIETVNLYSAFTALSLLLLEPGGELVAIIPRSFCNGPYYKPFRELILREASLKRVHLFGARDKAFRDDDVLQENVIIHLVKGGVQGEVMLSASTDDSYADLTSICRPFEDVVFPGDSDRFIHLQADDSLSGFGWTSAAYGSLAYLGLQVSTGPIVDFRMKEHLRAMPEAGTVPLLYPAHFRDQSAIWPKLEFKKSNAIVRNEQTERWLHPMGFYTVVRRFSSKEEHRRIVASVVEPSAFPGVDSLAFENHLNVFHHRRGPLSEDVAYGLAVYLNTSLLDSYFRTFNGHTQVNATDLRRLQYPHHEGLVALGRWAKRQTKLEQEGMDEQLRALTA